MIINLRVEILKNTIQYCTSPCKLLMPPYRIMDNLTFDGDLEHTLVLSLVEEIEVAATIIIVFLVRYFAI